MSVNMLWYQSCRILQVLIKMIYINMKMVKQ